MKRVLAFLAVVAIVAACSITSTPTAPIESINGTQANTECRSGWVVRTGRDGRPDSTCADDQ